METDNNELEVDLFLKDAQQALNEQKQKASDLAKHYHRCFKTDAGQKVLEDLTNRFIMLNDTDIDAKNVTYEAGFHNGEGSTVKHIILMIQQAEIL